MNESGNPPDSVSQDVAASVSLPEAGAAPPMLPLPAELVWQQYLSAAAAGDQFALGRLYDETSRLVYSVAARVLGPGPDAEEVTLDVYAYVWKHAGQYSRERGGVRAWLIMMARSRAIDRLRSSAGRTRFERRLDERIDFPDRDLSPEKRASDRQTREHVRRAIAALPEVQREALDLAFYSGWTHSELAERLGLPVGTVKTRIRLAMRKLRDLLNPGLLERN